MIHACSRGRRGSAGARSGVRLPIVLPRKATSRRPSFGTGSMWRWKSPTTACTSHPGVLIRQGRGRRPQGSVADVERDVALQLARALHGVEQDP